MAAYRSRRVVRKPGLWLLLLALALTACIGGVLWQAVHTSSVVAVHTRIVSLQPVLTMTRVLVVVLVALLWPAAVRTLHRWGRIDGSGAVRLLSWRWRVVAWLVIVELLLAQGLAGMLLGALPGIGA